MAGGGKESPRQKMIGMMYLVLTALLAMNVSKDILKAFVTVNDGLERTNKNFSDNTTKVMEAFKVATESNGMAKPYYDKAIEARKYTSALFEYMEKLKHAVIDETEKIEKKDTLRLRYADKKDNYDAPTHLMIGDDERNPKTGPNTAKELRAKMNECSDKLVALLESMQKDKSTKLLPEDFEALKKKIATLKPIDDPNDTEDGVKITWEIVNFYHLPLAGVITNITKMESDVKNLEAEMINQLSGASGKVAIKFDKLSAKVIAPSAYVQTGTPYTADIFLAASSSSMTADQMKVFIGPFDTIAKKPLGPGTPVDIKDGMGKYAPAGGAIGEQKYSGWIEFKKPTGDIENYPFSASYMVAAPAVAVSPDFMNVFYIGVDNPVTIQAAGIAPTQLTASMSGGTISPKGAGKYNVKVTNPGDATINVSGNGKSQGSVKFRVKRIPDPIAKVGGQMAFGTLTMSKLQATTVGGIVAEVQGFDFPTKFIVKSFTFSAVVKGALKEFSCSGPNLSGEAKGVIGTLPPGGKFFLENIKATGPDGSTRTLPNVIVKIK